MGADSLSRIELERMQEVHLRDRLLTYLSESIDTWVGEGNSFESFDYHKSKSIILDNMGKETPWDAYMSKWVDDSPPEPLPYEVARRMYTVEMLNTRDDYRLRPTRPENSDSISWFHVDTPSWVSQALVTPTPEPEPTRHWDLRRYGVTPLDDEDDYDQF